jgi:hypothetical protein
MFANRSSVRNWLRSSRFSTSEARNLIELMEDLSDFTLRERPDVFLLEVDCLSDDIKAIKQFVQSPGPDADISIFALSSDPRKRADDCFVGDLEQVAARLETMIPLNARSQAAN